MKWVTYIMFTVYTQSVLLTTPYPGDLLLIGNKEVASADEDITSLANLHEETNESFVDLENVTFILYDRLNFENPISMRIGDERLPEMFNPSYDTIITIHGWISGPWIMNDVIESYNQTGKDYNLMAADWSPASGAGIIVSSLIAADIGDKIAEFIDFLSTKGLSPSKIILIGYSLGCHVAGTAGFRVTSGRVGTIIALEPLRPVFNLFPSKLRLTREDADFVVVIHTEVGDLGYVGDLGHADFYPNGGVDQPGCDQDSIEIVMNICSHCRSKDYFVESITSPIIFNVTLCYSWNDYIKGRCKENPTVAMGAYTPTSARGRYYLSTNSESPFTQESSYVAV